MTKDEAKELLEKAVECAGKHFYADAQAIATVVIAGVLVGMLPPSKSEIKEAERLKKIGGLA